MFKHKRTFSIIFAVFFTFYAMLGVIPQNVFAAVKKPKVQPKAAPKIQVVISGFKKSYYVGDQAIIKATTKNYTAVQYSAVVLDSKKKTYKDLTKGYTRSVRNTYPYQFRIPTDKPGTYIVRIYAKKTGAKTYESTWISGYTVKAKPKVIIKEPTVIEINKNGSVVGSSNASKMDVVKKDVKITAQNVTFRNTKLQGDLYISADNSNINNVTVDGTVYIDPGENGNATLKNVTATKLEVLSGGQNSIHFVNVEAEVLSINSSSQVRVETTGNTSITNTEVSSSAILDSKSGTLGTVVVKESTKGEVQVELRGTFTESIIVQSSATIKTDKTANVSRVEIAPDNSGTVKLQGTFNTVEVKKEARLEIADGTQVKNIIADTKTDLNLGKDAVIEKVETKGNEIKQTGEGEIIVKDETKPEVIVVTGIRVSPSDLHLKEGETVSLSVDISPSDATNKGVSWSSSNSSVATVSGGTVKAVKEGSATITVTTLDGGKTATCSVSVEKAGVDTEKEAAIKAAIDAIAALPSPDTIIPSSKSKIDAASALVDAAIAKGAKSSDITNLDKLNQCKAKLEKAVADMKAAIKAAIDAIAALPSPDAITAADEARIKAASALVDAAKAKGAIASDITNLDKLTQCQAKLNQPQGGGGPDDKTAAISVANSALAVIPAANSITISNYNEAKTKVNDADSKIAAATAKGAVNSDFVGLDKLSAAKAKISVIESVLSEKNNLTIRFADGDTKDSVTKDLPLETSGANGVAISWSSSNPAVISNLGKVTRPTDADKTVTLTATISKENVSITITFTVKVIKATSNEIVINAPDNLSVKQGETKSLGVTTTPSTGVNVTYSGYDSSIIEVGSTGNITGLKEGSTSITVKANAQGYEEVTKIINVTVTNMMDVIVSINGNNVTVDITNTIVKDDVVTIKICENSSGTVKGSGQINLANGRGTYTASNLASGDYYVIAKGTYAGEVRKNFTIGAIKVTGITLDKTIANLNAGETVQLTATIVPDKASEKGVNWSTSDEKVVTVDSSGLVKAIAAGTATITATTVDGSFKATCTVTVTAPTADKAALIKAIADAETLIASKTVGTEPGNVPQSAKTAFQAAIDAAKTVRDKADATQADVDAQVAALVSATTAFISAVIPTPATLVSIEITHPAGKLVYNVGEPLDITGLEVTGHYSDGSSKVETVTAANITGFDSSAPVAGQVLTITIGGKTATYTVEIKAVPVTLLSIEITHPAGKLVYNVGEPLDITGLEVTGHYSDGSSKVETITAANITGFDSSTPVASQTITITVGGKAVTYTVEIKAVASICPPITIGNASIPYSDKDQDVNVDITVPNGTGPINLLDLQIKYDNTKLTFKNAGYTADQEMLVNPYSSGTGDNDTLAIIYTSVKGITTPQSGDSRLVTLTFTVKGGTTAGTSIPLEVINDPVNSTPQMKIDNTLYSTNTNNPNKILINAGAIAITEPLVDKSALGKAIADAETLIASKTVGTEPGNVPQKAKDDFQAAIDAAKAVRDKADATQMEVDAQLEVLTAAAAVFNSAVITVDKTALNKAIADAEILIASRTVGTEPGNVLQKTKDTFQAAIDAAKAVYNNPKATQAEVDEQAAALAAAATAFSNAVVKVSPLITIGSVSVPYSENDQDVSVDITVPNGTGPINLLDLQIKYDNNKLIFKSASNLLDSTMLVNPYPSGSGDNDTVAIVYVSAQGAITPRTGDSRLVTLTFTVKGGVMLDTNIPLAAIDDSNNSTPQIKIDNVLYSTDSDNPNRIAINAGKIMIIAPVVDKAEAIKAAVDAIAALPEPDSITLADKQLVVDARILVKVAKANGAVDSDIANLQKLKNCEARIADLEQAAQNNLNAIVNVSGNNVNIIVTNIGVKDDTVTITIYNKSTGKLASTGQVTLSEGKGTYNASLPSGTYYAVLKGLYSPELTTEDFMVSVVNVTGITLDKITADMKAGDILKLTATITPDNASDKGIAWSTSNQSVATVDEYGWVKAIAAGTATITAATMDGNFKATCTVTVTDQASMDKAAAIQAAIDAIAALPEANAITLADKTRVVNARELVEAAKSKGAVDSDIANLQKLKDCEARIADLEQAAQNNLSAIVNVSENNVSIIVTNIGVKDDTVTITIYNKSTGKLASTGQVTLSEGKGTYNASLPSGTYYAVLKGLYSPEITTEDFIVTVVNVTGITLDKATADMKAGDILKLTATILPDNASDKGIAWSTSNQSVATVDEYGWIKAIAAGTATITAATLDGNFKATCTVTVTDQASMDKAAAIQAAIDAIAALPEANAITLADKTRVVNARELVEAAKSKGAVDSDIANLQKLKDCEARIADLEQAAQNNLSVVVNVLGNSVSITVTNSGVKDDTVTIRIMDRGTGKTAYNGQAEMTDGQCAFGMILPNGTYYAILKGMFGGTVTTTDFTVSIDRTALSKAIADAEALIAGKTVGTELGNVSQKAKDDFQAVINSAKAILDKADVTQAEVDAQVAALVSATTAFNSAVIKSGPAITIGNVSVPYSDKDQDVNVDITVPNGTGPINLLDLQIKYDNTKLTFKSASNLLDSTMLVNPYASGTGDNDTVAVVYTSVAGITTPQTGDSRLVTLTFTVKGGTSIDTNVVLAVINDPNNSTPQMRIDNTLYSADADNTNRILVNSGSITVTVLSEKDIAIKAVNEALSLIPDADSITISNYADAQVKVNTAEGLIAEAKDKGAVDSDFVGLDKLNAAKAKLNLITSVLSEKNSLTIGYATGDSEISVTKDLTLTTSGANGVVISWSSSNPAVISNDGKVTRPADSDKDVVLTAVISNGNVSDSKTFNVKVIKVISNEIVINAPDSVSVKQGETIPLGITITPSTGVNITYSGYDQNIIEVGSAGNITGIKEGTTAITVKASAQGYADVTKTINVAVTNMMDVTVGVDGNNVTIDITNTIVNNDVVTIKICESSSGAVKGSGQVNLVDGKGTYTASNLASGDYYVIVKGMYAGEVRKNFTIGAIAVDKTALNNAITDAETLIGSKTVGTEPGNVTESAKIAFQNAIDAAKAVRDKADATQADVDAQVAALATATTVFISAVIPTPATLVNIEITHPASKLVYNVGEPLDITGLQVTGHYSDGSTKIEAITAANITGFDSSKSAASQTLTITIGGKTATYTVEIKAVASICPPITIGSVSIPYSDKDQNVNIDITVPNGTGPINLLQLDIKYDNTKLTFKDAGYLADQGIIVNAYTLGTGNDDTVAIVYTSVKGITTPQSGDSRLVTLTFTLKGGTAIDTNIPLVAIDDPSSSTPQMKIDKTLYSTDSNNPNKILINAGTVTIRALSEKEAAIKAAIDVIAALPEPAAITLADKQKVVDARTVADTAIAKGATEADITGIQKLKDCEAKIVELEQAAEKAAAIKAAVDAIAALPEPAAITLADKANVEAARTLVGAAYGKGAVDGDITNLQKLVDCEAKIAELEQAAAERAAAIKSAVDAITALPEPDSITIADKSKVDEAQALVDAAKEKGALSSDITNLEKLIQCETKIASLVSPPPPVDLKGDAIKAAVNAITALPEPTAITLADKQKVVDARTLVGAAYDKGAVDTDIINLQKLVGCEAKIAELEQAAKN